MHGATCEWTLSVKQNLLTMDNILLRNTIPFLSKKLLSTGIPAMSPVLTILLSLSVGSPSFSENFTDNATFVNPASAFLNTISKVSANRLTNFPYKYM